MDFFNTVALEHDVRVFYTCRYRKVWDLLYSDPDKEQCTLAGK